MRYDKENNNNKPSKPQSGLPKPDPDIANTERKGDGYKNTQQTQEEGKR